MSAIPLPPAKDLSELTVLELCSPKSPQHTRLAIAMAGRLLADLGIRVVRVEGREGDGLDQASPLMPDGKSAVSAFLGLGKVGISTADEAERAGAVGRLLQAGVHGVLFDEFEPLKAEIEASGAPTVEMATWPVGLETLGPSAQATEFGVLAASGMLDIIGDPARQPLRLGGHQIAYAAGLSAFSAAMVAIYRKDFSGASSRGRVSLLETAIWLNWKAVAGPYAGQEVPTREGDGADFQVLACVDGWVAFVYLPLEFNSVRKLIGDPALNDPKFATVASRRANIRDIMEIARPWFAARTRAEINRLAQQAGVPIGPVFTPRELLTDAQYVASDFIAHVPDTGGAALQAPRSPASVNGARHALRRERRARLDDVLGGRI